MAAKDQYADGVAVNVWDHYIGDAKQRTDLYRDWMVDLLRNHGCHYVLDVAVGTGIDSVMLLEEGFSVTSCDGCDKMVHKACQVRWDRRTEPGFNDWEIKEANWLTLHEDITKPGGGFDAIICIGNSFPHLPNSSDYSNKTHKQALRNFCAMLKPEGVLIIDHRNFDAILDSGKLPVRNIYYQGTSIADIKTSIVYHMNNPEKVVFDFTIDLSRNGDEEKQQSNHILGGNTLTRSSDQKNAVTKEREYKFQLSCYPHRVKNFTNLLYESFGDSITHNVYGDYKPAGEVENPAYWIHVIKKNDEIQVET